LRGSSVIDEVLASLIVTAKLMNVIHFVCERVAVSDSGRCWRVCVCRHDCGGG